MQPAVLLSRVVGGILFGIAVIKFFIIGYYPDEMLRYGVVMAIGAALLWVGERLDDREVDPEPQPHREP